MNEVPERCLKHLTSFKPLSDRRPQSLNPRGRSGWIVLSIVMLVIGVVFGVGISSLRPATITVTETIPLSVTTTTKTMTETITTTVTSVQMFAFKPAKAGEITSIEFMVKDDEPILYVRFKTSTEAIMRLIGPDGEQKFLTVVSPYETGAYLCMTGCELKTPLAGQYRIILENSLFGKLAEKTLEFTGYNVTATKLEIPDKEWSNLSGGSIRKIVVYLRNDGDLPTYVEKAKIVFDGKKKSYPVFSEPVPPGESNISISVWITNISKGTHTIKVTLVNDKGEDVATIQGKVTFP